MSCRLMNLLNIQSELIIYAERLFNATHCLESTYHHNSDCLPPETHQQSLLS